MKNKEQLRLFCIKEEELVIDEMLRRKITHNESFKITIVRLEGNVVIECKLIKPNMYVALVYNKGHVDVLEENIFQLRDWLELMLFDCYKERYMTIEQIKGWCE